MKRPTRRRPFVARALSAGPAFAGLTLTRAGLRLLSLPRLARLLGVRLGTERGAAPRAIEWSQLPSDIAVRLASVDAALRRWPSNAPCLVRSLSVGWLLRRRQPTLRIGIATAPTDASWSAHAWLEVAGMTLPEPRHAPLQPEAMRALGQV